MQPFVAADAGAFNPLIASIPDPLANLQKQIAFKIGMESEQANNLFKRAQVSAQVQKVQRQAQFATAMQTYLAHPTAEGLASLIGNFPEFADEAKSAGGAIDAQRDKADLTQLGEVTSLASKGDYAKAAELLRARIQADKAANHEDPHDALVLEMLESGDPAKEKQALGLLTLGVALKAGVEHAGSFLPAAGLTPDVTVIDGVAVDKKTGEPLYQSPFGKVYQGPEGFYVQNPAPGIPILGRGTPGVISESGATGAKPAPASDPVIQQGRTTIASAFSQIGLPAPVIAGFLGNFDVEGGWGGSTGDGGKAKGIAGWHPDRLANYEKAVGRPFDPSDHQGQAQFVLWELQHPEAAGMTVAQRDAILNAKTAPQAAALIDQFYERSSGRHRPNRMRAAAEHFGALTSGENYAAATHTATVGGKTYYQINGQWYDNPEGR